MIEQLPVLDKKGQRKLALELRTVLLGSARSAEVEACINKAIMAATSNARSEDTPFRLMLAAAGWIGPAPMPRTFPDAAPSEESGLSRAMKISLRGYTYPGLTAKRLSFNLPFFSWDQVQSVLTLRIQGPLSDSSYGGERYDAAATFVLVQDEFRRADGRRSKESDGRRVGKWIKFADVNVNAGVKATWSSALLAIPGSQALVLSATVMESSELKKRILELSERVGDIEIDAEELGIE